MRKLWAISMVNNLLKWVTVAEEISIGVKWNRSGRPDWLV